MIAPALIALALAASPATAEPANQDMKPEATEVWEPQPPVVAPKSTAGAKPPKGAIVLFGGKDLGEWVSVKDGGPALWTVADGVFTVKKGTGNIETKRKFTNYKLHLEWRTPNNITGQGQSRGNSGLFLASTGKGDAGYEIQILDSYNNKTYANGMVGSIYKQAIPLANPMRGPGEWNAYDLSWTAPVFNADGSLKSPARITARLNGVLVQDDFAVQGETVYIGKPKYKAHGPSAIKLQDHGDPSEPISFRNIWIQPGK